jgi:FixJ family two-component response regulator
MTGNIIIQTFVLDDDFVLLKNIAESFELAKIENYRLFDNESDFFKAINKDVMVCVVDYWLGDKITGIDVIKKVLEINHKCRFVVISAKPIELEELIQVKNYGPIPFISKVSENFNDDLLMFVKRSVTLATQERELYREIMKKVAV